MIIDISSHEASVITAKVSFARSQLSCLSASQRRWEIGLSTCAVANACIWHEYIYNTRLQHRTSRYVQAPIHKSTVCLTSDTPPLTLSVLRSHTPSLSWTLGRSLEPAGSMPQPWPGTPTTERMGVVSRLRLPPCAGWPRNTGHRRRPSKPSRPNSPAWRRPSWCRGGTGDQRRRGWTCG